MGDDMEYLTLKVVGTDSNEVHFKLKWVTPLGKLKRSYSERMGVPVSSVRFLFDGKRIGDDDTPKSLKMENNDEIEVFYGKGGPIDRAKTALRDAVQKDNTNVIKFLLTFGANVNAKFDGETPLDLALAAGKIANCKILIEHGAEFGQGCWFGEDYEYLLRYQQSYKKAVKQVTNNEELISENRYTELTCEEIQWLKELKAKKVKEVDSQMISMDHKLDEVTTVNKNRIKVIQNQVDEVKENCDEKITALENEITIARKKLNDLEFEKNAETLNMKTRIKTLEQQEKEIRDSTDKIEFERLVTVVTKSKLNKEFKMIDFELKRKGFSESTKRSVTGKTPSKTDGQEFVEHLKQQISSMEQELECPVCLEVSEVPIYTCPSQHHICAKCWSDVKSQDYESGRYPCRRPCPVCRQYIEDPPAKHRSLEKMAQQLKQARAKLDKILSTN